jgi:hypothetical protein
MVLNLVNIIIIDFGIMEENALDLGQSQYCGVLQLLSQTHRDMKIFSNIYIMIGK